MSTPPAEPVETPLLRIVKGNPKPEEVAALVAVVSALASAPGPEEKVAALGVVGPASDGAHHAPARSRSLARERPLTWRPSPA